MPQGVCDVKCNISSNFFSIEQIQICLSSILQHCERPCVLNRFLRAYADINTSNNQPILIHSAVWHLTYMTYMKRIMFANTLHGEQEGTTEFPAHCKY